MAPKFSKPGARRTNHLEKPAAPPWFAQEYRGWRALTPRGVAFEGIKYCGRGVGLSYLRLVPSAHFPGRIKGGGKEGYTKSTAGHDDEYRIEATSVHFVNFYPSTYYRHTYLQGCDVGIELLEQLGYPEGVVLPAPIVPHVNVKIDHPHLMRESPRKCAQQKKTALTKMGNKLFQRLKLRGSFLSPCC